MCCDSMSGDSRYRDVQTMHRAEVNIEGSFYGVTDTSEALRAFARAIGDPELAARTEQVVAREQLWVAKELAPMRARLAGKRALVFSGGFKSWSTVSAVQDLGMTVVATGIEKLTDEDKDRIRKLLGADARLLDNNDQEALLRTFPTLPKSSCSASTSRDGAEPIGGNFQRR